MSCCFQRGGTNGSAGLLTFYGGTNGSAGLLTFYNVVICKTPDVGAPFMTPVARQGETADGLVSAMVRTGSAVVIITPFRRAGVTSGAPTYNVLRFSAWRDKWLCWSFDLLQRRYL